MMLNVHTFLYIILLGLFFDVGCSIDIPGSFVRRVKDNNQSIDKIINSKGIKQSKNELQNLFQATSTVATPSSDVKTPTQLKVTESTVRTQILKATLRRSLKNVTATTTDITEDVILSSILTQIVEIIVFNIAQLIVDTIVGILTGASVDGASSTGGLTALMNSTSIVETADNVTASITNITSNGGEVTEETIGDIITSIFPQVIEIAVSTVFNAIFGIIDSFINNEAIVTIIADLLGPIQQIVIDAILNGLFGVSGEAVGSLNTTSLNVVETDLVIALTNATSGGEVNADTIAGILAEALPQIVEAIILIFAGAIANAINDLIFGLASALPSNRRMLETELSRSLSNVTATTTDTSEDVILNTILSQIVEVVVFAIAQLIVDTIVGILTGASLDGASSTGELSVLMNSTVIAEAADNVTESITNITSNGGEVTEETIGDIVAAILPQVIEIAVSTVSDAIVGIVDSFIGSETIVLAIADLLGSFQQTTIDAILNGLFGVSGEAVGSLNTTSLNVVETDLVMALTNATSSGEVNADTIAAILADALPQIIEAIILIFAGAIANAINDILFGLASALPSNRRMIETELSRSLTNVTANTTDTTEDVILSSVLSQIVEIVVIAIAQLLINAIIGLLTGASMGGAAPIGGLRNIPDKTNTTENETDTSIGQGAIVKKFVGTVKSKPIGKARGIMG
jgi:hypothetical protein